MRPTILIPAILLCACSARSQYNGPESVEYDAANDRYLVSNTGDGTIKQRDQAGTVTAFASVSPAPYGLEIMGDTVFACSGGTVKGFLLSTGAQVFNLNLGGSFLNGIATDGTYLYVTDFSALKIFRVDPAAGTFTTWVAATGSTPNGIVYDATNDRLAVACWGSNAPVKTYDRATAAAGPSINTGLTNIDGITIDCAGRYLLASWSPDHISALDPSLSLAPVDLAIAGLNNPADIDFDEVHQLVCAPNAGNNTVTLAGVFPCTTSIPNNTADAGYEDLRVIPNPADGMVRIAVDLAEAVSFLLLDARGLLVGGGTLPKSGLLDLSHLANGSYIIDIPALRKRARFVKG